jgi:photosynthetic reaction center cytochrome c subunit
MKLNRVLIAGAAASSLVLLAACHRTQTVQRGYRGQASIELWSDQTLEKLDQINKYPKPVRAASPDGPKASEIYENVQVVGDLSKQQFARLMISIKTWVAPDVGCNYCHAAPNYSSDAKYTKRVAREMLRMTRHLNTDWSSHVKQTGVTCFTCHRGQPVPQYTWYLEPERNGDSITQWRPPIPLPTPAAGNTGLPRYAMNDYLLGDANIRVVGTTALQSGNRRGILQGRESYALMMVIAESLGVNCTFCHYTAAFYNWDMSTPQRAQAWYGIRMVRDINNSTIPAITHDLPPERLGLMGDAPKVYCKTCHQGSNKPLWGAAMLKYYPELVSPHAAGTAPSAPVTTPLPPATVPAGVAPPSQTKETTPGLPAKAAQLSGVPAEPQG